jgi:oligoribonuclease (3'-5' exoribonuclease)
VHAGFRTIAAQAQALGLSRSTAWAIFQGQHKGSGLSSSVIERMLKSPELPAPVRAKILEYVEEKSAGLYGGSLAQRRKFAVVLATRGDGRPDPAGTSRAPALEKKAG